MGWILEGQVITIIMETIITEIPTIMVKNLNREVNTPEFASNNYNIKESITFGEKVESRLNLNETHTIIKPTEAVAKGSITSISNSQNIESTVIESIQKENIDIPKTNSTVNSAEKILHLYILNPPPQLL